MMASRVLSRFLPGAESGLDGQTQEDVEFSRRMEDGRAPRGNTHFRDDSDDQELENMLLDTTAQSIGPRIEHGISRRTEGQVEPHKGTKAGQVGSPKRNAPVGDSADEDEIPESLLMEGNRLMEDTITEDIHGKSRNGMIASTHPRWKAAQDRRRPARQPPPPSMSTNSTTRPGHKFRIDPREQALWRWANISNVDGFLLEVYQYFVEHGIWSICISRLVYVLTTAFLFGMYMFMSTCVDYSKIPHSRSTSEILIPQCMKNTSFLKSAALWLFVFWWLWTVFRYITDIPRLWQLHDFFHHLLKIPDSDIQTIPWERVVEGLMSLREANPETADNNPKYFHQVLRTTQSKQRMDAHDIANRLMRRDNYYIALLNKEILDLSLPLPFLGSRQYYSKSLEWCIGFCFENFIFDEHGHVQPSCLSTRNRQKLIEALRRRFRFAAIISIFMAPFNIGAHCVYYFSRYYAEFRNSPAQLGARAFTPHAEWKMREFNELEHNFRRRMKMAYPFADRYLNQFPKDKTNQALQFVGLVSGTIAAILGIATLLDPELFLGFEITEGRTAFFYLSVSMGIFAAARGAVPDDNEVHEPVLHLFEVIDYTHYCPTRWKGQLHSNAVRNEFSALYQMKILIFLEEILSLVVAPFILWRNSGSQSKDIIDFFRQYTVHVDGLGPLCHHAVFEFRKRKNAEDDDVTSRDKDAKTMLRNEYYGAAAGAVNDNDRDEKMALSQYYFMQRLGQYDQQQANRHYNRHYHNVPLPPSFPPLSPLKEAADARKRPSTTTQAKPADTKGKGKLTAIVPTSLSSPHQSLLLDLNHARSLRQGPVVGNSPLSNRAAVRNISHSRQLMPPLHTSAVAETEDLDELDRDLERDLERDMMADLTTSKLIEQDRSLAESWKDEDEGDGHGDVGESSKGKIGEGKSTAGGGGAGVLGMLVEYSKAQAGVDRGGRRGSRIG